MKLKKILVVSIVLLTIFFIYLTTMDKKVYFVGLGDDITLGITNQETQTEGYNKVIKEYLESKKILEEYIMDFSNRDSRTTDLINDIEMNKKIKINQSEKTIKNVLIKADLVTVSIGANDLSYKIKTGNKTSIYNYIDEELDDLEKLFQLLKEYCKEDIFYIGIYNPYGIEAEPYYQYSNNQIEKICKKYNIIYIDSNKILKEVNGLESSKGRYPTQKGYQELGNQIIKKIENTLLNS